MLSTLLTGALGNNSRVVSGAVPGIVTELKATGEAQILIHSSPPSTADTGDLPRDPEGGLLGSRTLTLEATGKLRQPALVQDRAR